MKTIVTHIGPDLDAITSVWLMKTFYPNWEEAAIAFVPAGTTFKGEPVDSDPEIIHVDTGFGVFDHHQSDADVCAATLVYKAVKQHHGEDKALERLTNVVNDVDHFRNVFFPNPTADFWEFDLASIIDGWRLIYSDNPLKYVELGMDALDAVYKNFQNKIWAESELETIGKPFHSKWGDGMAVETTNDDVMHVGQKKGFRIMIRKDPKKGYTRVKTLPVPDIDLTPLYEKLKEKDTEATWFLHASKHMLLNGSAKNPQMRPTKLSINEIIAIVESIT